MMDFKQIQYFVAVAEELHFGRAADRLQITQPALSKQIARLEKTLDVVLLFRTKRTVSLTHAGKTFLQQARQLLNQKESAIQLTRQTSSGDIGALSIGFTKTAVQTVLPPLLRDFVARYPRVEINMAELATEAQVNALNKDTIDIAFLHPPIDERGLQVHPILEEQFVVVLPPGHSSLCHSAIPLKALANHSLIIHPRHEGPALYDGFLQVCQRAGFQPQVIRESISLQTRLCFVAAGLGVTFVSEHLQSFLGDKVVCRPIEDCPVHLQFGAAWRHHSSNPALHNLLKILLAESNEDVAKKNNSDVSNTAF